MTNRTTTAYNCSRLYPTRANRPQQAWSLGLILGLTVFHIGTPNAHALPQAVMQANLRPVLTPAISVGNNPEGDGPNPGFTIDQTTFDPSNPQHVLDIHLQCVPANTPVKLLRFSMNTYNDGYVDFYFNTSDPTVNPNAFYFDSVVGQWMLRDFSAFTLVNATTKANAVRITGQGTQAVMGSKIMFSLASDDPISYRGDAPIPADPLPQNHGPGSQFVSWGYYDEYDLLHNSCQYLIIDGLADGDYDVVVEENVDRLIVCSAANDTSCPYDGRVFDNATAVRLRITNGTFDPLTPFPAPAVERTVTPIGPTTAGPPAVITQNINTYDLYYIRDNRVYAMHQGTDGTWPATGTVIYDLAGTLFTLQAGTLAAVAVDRTHVDLFAATTAGDVLHFSGDGRSSWQPIQQYGVAANGTSSSPTVVASGATSAMAAWMNPQGKFVYATFSASGWSTTPQVMSNGSFIAGQIPALVSSGDGVFHAFVRDGGGKTFYKRYSGANWETSTWRGLFGSANGNLTAASPYLSRVDVFENSLSTNKLQRNTWDGTTDTFSGWIDDISQANCTFLPLNGSPIPNGCHAYDGRVGAPPTVISTGDQKLDVFYYDSSPVQADMLWRLHYDGTNPSNTTPWTLQNLGRTGHQAGPLWPIVAGSWADNTLDLFQQYSSAQVGLRSMR